MFSISLPLKLNISISILFWLYNNSISIFVTGLNGFGYTDDNLDTVGMLSSVNIIGLYASPYIPLRSKSINSFIKSLN